MRYIYQFVIKDIMKNMNEQPGEGIYGTRSRRVPGAGAPVSVELGGPFPHADVLTDSETL